MPPRRDPLAIEPESNTAGQHMANNGGPNPLQELANVINELVQRQPQNAPDPFRLDTHFQLPKFAGQMNGEVVDSWIRSLSTYFRTCPEISEARKLQIAALQLEGTAQAWWDTKVENTTLVVDLGVSNLSYFLILHSILPI